MFLSGGGWFEVMLIAFSFFLVRLNYVVQIQFKIFVLGKFGKFVKNVTCVTHSSLSKEFVKKSFWKFSLEVHT